MTAIINIAEMQALAKNQLTKEVYDFFVGGANDEFSLRRNDCCYENIMLVPRILTGSNFCDPSVKILNLSLNLPILAAPMAFQCLAHNQGEIAMAKALKKSGLAYIASTMATISLENIINESRCPSWFQLYIYKDRELSLELLQRAISAGYQAIVVTVDVPIMGKRERDIKNQFCLPQNFSAANFNNIVTSDLALKTNTSAIKSFTDNQFDTSLTWKDIEWLKTHCPVPLVIKGILRDSDAETAMDRGVDAIIISNHGGRQLDGVPSAIDCLPKIAKRINKKIPLLIDGGVKRGTDILKAIALGASAVLIGRPFLWGLTVDGENGVADVISILKKEFIDTMILCGYKTVEEIAEDNELIFKY